MMNLLNKNMVFFFLVILLAGFVSAGDKLVDGEWYFIRGKNNTWASYDNESKHFKLKTADSKSRFKAVKKEDNKFVFELTAGEYLSASNDDTVTIRENPWDWEKFTVEEAPNQRYYLRSHHGNYLRTNYYIKQLDLSPLRLDWEAIEFIKESGDKLVDGEWYSIKSYNNTWVSYDKDSKNFRLESDAFKSQFKAVKIKDNKFAFQLAPEEYLSASNDGTVTIRENPLSWETFTVEDAPDQKYYLRSTHGNYLRTNSNKNTLDLSPYKQEWEKIQFVKGQPSKDFIAKLKKVDVRLIFIRHGYSCSNLLGDEKFHDFSNKYPDPELTSIGVVLAQRNGRHLLDNLSKQGVKINLFASSSLIRAMETAYYMFSYNNSSQPLIYTLPYVAERWGEQQANTPIGVTEQKELISQKNNLNCHKPDQCPIKFRFSYNDPGRGQSSYTKFISWLESNLDRVLAEGKNWNPDKDPFTIAIITHGGFMFGDLKVEHTPNNAAAMNLLHFKKEGDNWKKNTTEKDSPFTSLNYGLTTPEKASNYYIIRKTLGQDRCRYSLDELKKM